MYFAHPACDCMKTRRNRHVTCHVKNAFCETLPDYFVERRVLQVFGNRSAHFVAELVVGHRGTRDSENSETGRESSLVRQPVQGWKQLPFRQVAIRTEDHDGAFRYAAFEAERVLKWVLQRHVHQNSTLFQVTRPAASRNSSPSLPTSGCTPRYEGSIFSRELAHTWKRHELVVEDHHIPRVALHFFFRVGSRNEHPGNTGISHFLEHMIFNGAQKYGLASLTAKLRRAAAITTRTPHQTDGLHTTGFLQQR
ncbi:MAG: hypothetical protein DMG57_15075 [Acidobacteria bacterium]|nr:MAG: hypothetical protein DMG57_15075 [Acidobacteriota bacterium]